MRKHFLSFIIIVLFLGCTNQQNSKNCNVQLTVVSYGGGTYHQSHIDAFINPYKLYTGFKVNPIVWNAEYGKLKSMIQSRNVTWDVVEVTDAILKRGIKEGLFEKLSVFPDTSTFISGTASYYAVGNVYWGTVLAYNKKKYNNNVPSSWKDFWDVTNFPGRRALYDNPRGNLEFALLADGVSKDSLYPLDVERAFNKLDEIKPYIRAWWNDGTEPVQKILNNSIDISSAWSGRIFALGSSNKTIGYTWNDGALELDWWAVPKYSKEKIIASRFIAFASMPENMAKQAEMIGYGPVNELAFKYVNDSIKKHLPTYPLNWNKTFVINSDWWAKNEKVVLEKWLKWKSE